MERKISEISNLVSKKISSSLLNTNIYISTENLLPNFGGITTAASIPDGNVTAFQENDILLSNIRPYFKKIWFSKFEGGCSNDVLVIRANHDVLNKYLFYALNNEDFINYYVASCKGTKMPRGNKDALLDWRIDVPSISEQQHIVDTIGTIDDLIEKNQEITEKIKELRCSMFAHYSESSLDEVNLLELIELENGAQPPKEQHIYEEKDGYIRFIQNRDYDSESHLTYIPISKRNHICSKKDIMMDKYGEAGAVRYGIAGAFNVALLKITAKNNDMQEYIRDFLSQKKIKDILYLSSQASTRPSLNESTFTALKIPVLSSEQFENYQIKANSLLEYELQLKNKISKLKSLKQKLLSKYF